MQVSCYLLYMVNNDKILKQEQWQRTWAVPFLQECYGNNWTVTGGSIYSPYDISATNNIKNKTTLIEMKQWSNDPANYKNIIIKEDKVNRMLNEVHDNNTHLAYMVFHTPTATAYIVSLDNADDKFKKVDISQPIKHFDDEPQYKTYTMYLIPFQNFHKCDITAYLDKYGYNPYQMKN